MDELNSYQGVVFQSHDHPECRELRLVLESVGIAADLRNRDGVWTLVVDADEQAAAIAELEAYRREDPVATSARLPPAPKFSGAIIGVIVFAVIMVVDFIWASAMSPIVPRAGQMRAGDVMAGQWWRVLTALTLHADLLHLLSNLVFGGVFGLLVGRILGGGVGWLCVVVAGACGNLLNAMMRDAEHTSIGASTAVFAALGILVSHALRPRSVDSESLMKRWSPLVGGIVLFSLVGIGDERTDVLAHATGLLSGCVIGWFACRVPEKLLSRSMFQFFAGAVAVGIIALAWVVAINQT